MRLARRVKAGHAPVRGACASVVNLEVEDRVVDLELVALVMVWGLVGTKCGPHPNRSRSPPPASSKIASSRPWHEAHLPHPPRIRKHPHATQRPVPLHRPRPQRQRRAPSHAPVRRRQLLSSSSPRRSCSPPTTASPTRQSSTRSGASEIQQLAPTAVRRERWPGRTQQSRLVPRQCCLSRIPALSPARAPAAPVRPYKPRLRTGRRRR